MKPDFICIGAPKCGSTWLHSLLDTHPRVFLPEEIKEVHFFDRYWERGTDWYEKLFSKAGDDSVKGEVTPHYLYMDDVSRISSYAPNVKLILLHRDPVARCVSHYKFRMRLDNFKGSFQEFLVAYPDALEWGLYGKHLEKFIANFDREQLLVVEFEKAVTNVDEFKGVLAEFLRLELTDFPENSGNEKVNEAITVRFPFLYRLSVKISRKMVDLNLYGFRNHIKKILVSTLKKKHATKNSEISISSEDKLMLANYYQKDQFLFSQQLDNHQNKFQ